MSMYCKLIGHTYVVHVDNPKISWNVGKDLKELHITAEDGEPGIRLECRRCGARIENPSSAQIKLAHTNVRQA